MQGNVLFYIVFLSQIVLISFILPHKMSGRIRNLFTTYPPVLFPSLYPESLETYDRALRHYRNLNLLIVTAGLVLAAVQWANSDDCNWAKLMVPAYFMAQVIPIILVEIATHKYYKRMRMANPRTVRTAQLRPRRLLDFASPALIGVVVFVYLAFAALIIYIKQFDYPWFGGYLNIVGVTVANLIFAGILARSLYGKKNDPTRPARTEIGTLNIQPD